MVKPFKFSLENVLQYRSDVEEEKKTMYQDARQNLQIARDQYQDILSEIEDLNKMLRRNTGLSIQTLQQCYQYKNQLEARLTLQRIELEQKEIDMLTAQNQLIAAKQDVHVLEKLKEKKREVYDIELRRQENKQLDEFSTMSFASKG
ncbi:MAG TPA: flagellar export protein FliJ [Firmicutes bacterium]|nr:flagellar export protein FliJ [Bacillota bacterium]